MLQQLLLGFALEAEGAVLRVREARAPRRRGQLLEVGFLNGVAAGIHSRGGVPGGGGETGDHSPPLCRPQTPETPQGLWPSRTSPGPVTVATEKGRLGVPSMGLEVPHNLGAPRSPETSGCGSLSFLIRRMDKTAVNSLTETSRSK